MKNLYLFLFLIFISTHIRAQEIYFSSGKNTTNFDYKSSNGTHENLNFRSGTGNYFEVGYVHGLINYKLLYSIGFTYNEYNSKASNYSTNYSWKTKYIGITNKISFNLSKEYSECSHYGSGLRTFVSIQEWLGRGKKLNWLSFSSSFTKLALFLILITIVKKSHLFIYLFISKKKKKILSFSLF